MHKKVSYGGVGTALGIVLILIMSYVPSGRAALLFAASAIIYLMGKITDKRTSLLAYVATSLVAFLIVPSASPVLLWSYIICFGNFPIIRQILENKNKLIGIICKFILYILYFAGVYFTCTLIANVDFGYGIWLLFALGVPVFFFYDWLLFKTGSYAFQKVFKSF